jgi:hypothetical protein
VRGREFAIDSYTVSLCPDLFARDSVRENSFRRSVNEWIIAADKYDLWAPGKPLQRVGDDSLVDTTSIVCPSPGLLSCEREDEAEPAKADLDVEQLVPK